MSRRGSTAVERSHRLVVNPIACEAVGVCAQLAPEVVDLDRWGYPIPPEETLSRPEARRAQRAVRGCPRRALALVPLKGPD